MNHTYAVIVPGGDQGSNEPYEENINLSHALACLYALHDTAWGRMAYLAQRTPNGEWETESEAQARRENHS